ncbi:hypothetical protein GUITHDRAFT_137353 [Guillardia theta CCMP2712]|uniref:Uncharacterized protein n=1 Tax=Guillardia theta (strain CCMP2712) TaxID=905079 RepID=L1JHF6_GUITC|nr:hypothetical protein GUITHDRAFT_137353 [Guillardia theta CCMP2712]EKX47574.1 hypothetical protein GUITHDRAFT_137353 [Guillardia theta CCMP2712]|mmetsp:Transcript_43807/g.138406  ORF Transcript_43807/g.138406 Transcript_43807/m.138406 type:complete len:357 (-) Transcript_43807:35-1105(-)|eukprot:XP_005834554.1 hypothetical protein GUITHDRAFT_137353 [Guillardia theta CCMP2712]
MIPTAENSGTYSSILLQNEKASLGVKKDDHSNTHKKKSGSRCGGLLGTLLRRRIQRTERDLIPKVFRADECLDMNDDPCFFAAQTFEEMKPGNDEKSFEHVCESIDNHACSQPGSYFTSLFKSGESFKQALSASAQPWLPALPVAQDSIKYGERQPCTYMEMVQKQSGYAVKTEDPLIDLNSKQAFAGAHPYLTMAREDVSERTCREEEDCESSDLYSTSSSCSPAPSSFNSAETRGIEFPSVEELTQMSQTSRSLWSCFIEQHHKYKKIDFVNTELEAVDVLNQDVSVEIASNPVDQSNRLEDGCLSTEVLADALQTSDPLFASSEESSEESMLWVAPHHEQTFECDSEWSAINL